MKRAGGGKRHGCSYHDLSVPVDSGKLDTLLMPKLYGLMAAGASGAPLEVFEADNVSNLP